MSAKNLKLLVLLVDDEQENLDQLAELLPSECAGCELEWEPCLGFDEAMKRLELRHYDIVVTDLALRRTGSAEPQYKGLETVEAIRGKRFCPIVAYSTQSMPEALEPDAFVSFSDKSGDEKDLLAKLEALLKTGVPQIARRLHDELDGIGGGYLWHFLAKNWAQLQSTGATDVAILERLLRRRASTSLGRLDPNGKEIETIAGVEFFLAPKITPGQLRLGEILFEPDAKSYRVVLTPHCHLTLQQNQEKPKAEFVLTVKAVLAAPLLAKYFEGKSWANDQTAMEKKVRPVIGSTPSLNEIPSGRYWFVPAFLEMPDLYCDFLQIESLPFAEVDPASSTRFRAVAVLDTPFAEALQARFGEFYASVGTPNLQPKYFLHLLPTTSVAK